MAMTGDLAIVGDQNDGPARTVETLPTATIAMTAATPMMIPSIVKVLRTGFMRSARSATIAFGYRSACR